MSLRINKAKKFNGKSYIATDELNSLIQSMALTGNTLTLVADGKKVEGDAMTVKTIDLASLTSLANNSASLNGTATELISLSNNAFDAAGLTGFVGSTVADKIVTTDANGKLAYANAKVTTVAAADSATDTNIPTEAAVRSAVDAVASAAIGVSAGNGITITENGTTKTISSNLKIAKVETTSGYAASYKLQYLGANDTYVDVTGDTIDIVKDQFIKSATFGWSTASDASGAGWTTSKSATAIYPCIKLELYANSDSSSNSSESLVQDLFIPLNDVFVDKAAGNGINATDLASNVITVVADTTDTIYTTKGTATSVMSVGSSGVKASGIQAAIDLAVNDEHSVAATAISAVNGKVEAFESSVNASIADVVSNTNTALESSISSVNANVDAAVSSINTNVNAAISGVQADIATTVTSVNAAIGSAVTNVNNAASAAVTKAVELEETTYTFGTTEGAAITSGVVTITGVAGNVLAVFDDTGAQVYPEVTKVGAGTAATNTLTADYGASTPAASWTVLHTKAIAYTAGATASATAASAASYTAPAYSAATKTDVAAADAAAYDETTTVADLSYKNA